MIRPAISPRRITGSATAGIVNAARSGVRNIKDITETISNEPEVTKEEKFGINYVGFFGSRRVNKDLKKSMNTIRDSVGSTFGIAKSLKESVTKGAGVFGFVGKLIGGAAMALPIFGLLGIPIIKAILGIIAIGGIAALFGVFKKPIINGNPSPTKNPKSRNFFFMKISFIINLIQIDLPSHYFYYELAVLP